MATGAVPKAKVVTSRSSLPSLPSLRVSAGFLKSPPDRTDWLRDHPGRGYFEASSGPGGFQLDPRFAIDRVTIRLQAEIRTCF